MVSVFLFIQNAKETPGVTEKWNHRAKEQEYESWSGTVDSEDWELEDEEDQ